MNRHENHVARLEADVIPRIAAQEIVVQVQCRNGLAESLHIDAAQLGPLGHASRGVQRREHRAE